MDRFCISCQYYRLSVINPSNPDYAECAHPENVETDLVTGQPRKRIMYCCNMRRGGSPCGPKGLWWTQKEEQANA